MAEWIVRRLALAAARGMALAGGQAGAQNLPVMTVQQAMSLPAEDLQGSRSLLVLSEQCPRNRRTGPQSGRLRALGLHRPEWEVSRRKPVG